jgi:hypothetical protein
VLGSDDVLLLLTYLWARDTCTFPTEDQRHALAAILVLSIFTGARLGELVDATRRGLLSVAYGNTETIPTEMAKI